MDRGRASPAVELSQPVQQDIPTHDGSMEEK